MLGFVGFWNVILLWPFFLLLDYPGVEPFELPPKEIAGELGGTESTSRWQLSEAKQRLRRLLGDQAKMVSA